MADLQDAGEFTPPTTGQALDQGLQRFIDHCDRLALPPSANPSVAEQREVFRRVSLELAPPRPAGLSVADLAIPAENRQVPVRVYRLGEGARPGLLYLHGGGWVLGDLDTHDSVCAAIAATTGATVIAVAYRLAPEHTYPAPLDDAEAVLRHCLAQRNQLGLAEGALSAAGDSAGAALAVSLALRLRDAGAGQLRSLTLIYPALGLDFDTPSYRAYADGPLLTRDKMVKYWKAYLGEAYARPAPYAVPLMERDLSGLPSTAVFAAEHDVLRDDSRLFAERLAAAGVASEFEVLPGMVHSFLRAAGCSPAAQAALQRICARIGALACGDRP